MTAKRLAIDLYNFNLLMCPNRRLVCCHLWLRLVNENIDPVYEFNRTIEDFVTRKNPSIEALFSLLTQVLAFFYDFQWLENRKCRNFSHPRLKGRHELRRIGILEEFKKI